MPRKSRETQSSKLLIDTSAAAELPTVDAIHEWARIRRVFISSVMSELPEERMAAAGGIKLEGAQPVMFESFGGRDADPENAYLSEVESSDIYVGILGQRYGRLLPDRHSATHKEYLHAEEKGLRIAVWTSPEKDRDAREHALLEEVRAFHVVPEFHSPTDLRDQIQRRLRELAAEDLSPWCKLGHVVFRASTISDRGAMIVVDARVRGDVVANALEQMRKDKWASGFEGQFTWGGRSASVEVADIEAVTATARSKVLKIRVERKDNRSGRMEMSFSGHTADDLVEIDVRCGIFGEPNPLEPHYYGMFETMADPFEVLRKHSLPDESLRQVAELLFTEAMIGTERASLITTFRLGASVAGFRSLVVGWETPKRYSNVEQETRRVEGKVALP